MYSEIQNKKMNINKQFENVLLEYLKCICSVLCDMLFGWKLNNTSSGLVYRFVNPIFLYFILYWYVSK